MRKAITTLAVFSALSTAAFAADLPRKAPSAYVPAPAPMTTWTGCYIGGNIGGAFGHGSISGVSGSASGDGSGFAGGGQIGCDYQFSGGWVIGFRDMLDATSNKRSRLDQYLATVPGLPAAVRLAVTTNSTGGG